MKYLYSVIIIFVFSVNAGATERAYHNYIYSNLNFSFCYNFTSHDPVEYLYYKGLSTLLNEYIKEKIENGDLDNKKLEIQAGCTLFGILPHGRLLMVLKSRSSPNKLKMSVTGSLSTPIGGINTSEIKS